MTAPCQDCGEDPALSAMCPIAGLRHVPPANPPESIGARIRGMLYAIPEGDAVRVTLARIAADADAEIGALRRHIARLVHGDEIESDRICPHELEAGKMREDIARLTRDLDGLRAARDDARHHRDLARAEVERLRSGR